MPFQWQVHTILFIVASIMLGLDGTVMRPQSSHYASMRSISMPGPAAHNGGEVMAAHRSVCLFLVDIDDLDLCSDIFGKVRQNSFDK